MIALLIGFLATVAFGHGGMQWPPTWGDANGAVGVRNGGSCTAIGWGTGTCMVFTNYTFNTGATMASDSPMRTFGKSDKDGSNYKNNPWMAPGSAKLQSPCGVVGGNINGCPAGSQRPDPAACKANPYAPECTCPGGGMPYGEDTLAMHDRGAFGEGLIVTKWKAGSVQEAAFGLDANHGGGYSYRLAKVPASGRYSDLTEQDFQKGSLMFSGNKSWVQYADDARPSTNRTEFEAMRTTKGTWPEGSQWTRDPIAPCNGMGGGFYTNKSPGCGLFGTQFEPPVAGVQGYCQRHHGNVFTNECPWTIVDKLKVPAELEPGKYVLSWRWDCEQTSQVWTTCSDIEVVA